MAENIILTYLTALQSAPLWIALTTPPLCWFFAAIFDGFKSPLAGKWLGSCDLSKTQTTAVELWIVPIGKHLYGFAKVTMKTDVEYSNVFFVREKIVPNGWITISLKSTKAYLQSSLKTKLQGSNLLGTITVIMSSDVIMKNKRITLQKISNFL